MRTNTYVLQLTFLVTLSLACMSALSEEPVTRHYDWMTAGNVSGSHVLTIHPDGRRVSRFEFNDRGRGPDIEEELRSAPDGTLGSLNVTGHSYMGAPADETFEVRDGVAHWNSTLESGQAPGEGRYYLANDGTPERWAQMARALLASPEQELDMLPAGRAGIRRITDLELEDRGERQTVTLYEISGIELTPQYLWLDENRELFALAHGWMGLAPKGRSSVLPMLQAEQDQAEQNYHRQKAERLTQKLPEHWILQNVALLDVETGTVKTQMAVAVSNGKIVRVMERAQLASPASDDSTTRIIDGQGLTLIPGLWDMHTHMSLQQGLLQIAAGVTTVRDLGNDPQRLAVVREAFDSGEVIGPRTFAAGILDKKGPYSAPTGRLAESLEDALQMVREYAEQGYPQIKIYSSIEPEWVKPVADEAHRVGIRVSGHVPAFMTAEQAVRDGFDEIQHINMLFLNFLAGPEDDTRTPVRFTLVAEQAGSLDLDSPAVNDFIDLLVAKGTVVDPTVTIFDGMFRHRSGELNPEYAMIADHFPPALRRSLLAGDLDITDENAATYARSADALLKMIGKLHRAGVPLVAGTDALAGFTLHRELELYQQAGISPADVLKLATIGSARVMGVAETTGSIREGKNADFVLLAGNPLVELSALRRPVAVFKGDRWFDTARLYESVGVKPFTR